MALKISGFERFRGSSLAIRLGASILGLLLLSYLLLITFSLRDTLYAPRSKWVLGLLWVLGIAALTILVRLVLTTFRKAQGHSSEI
jgi:hypothetical protein